MFLCGRFPHGKIKKSPGANPRNSGNLALRRQSWPDTILLCSRRYSTGDPPLAGSPLRILGAQKSQKQMATDGQIMGLMGHHQTIYILLYTESWVSPEKMQKNHRPNKFHCPKILHCRCTLLRGTCRKTRSFVGTSPECSCRSISARSCLDILDLPQKGS